MYDKSIDKYINDEPNESISKMQILQCQKAIVQYKIKEIFKIRVIRTNKQDGNKFMIDVSYQFYFIKFVGH